MAYHRGPEDETQETQAQSHTQQQQTQQQTQAQQGQAQQGQANGQANGDTSGTLNPVVEVGLEALPGDWIYLYVPPFGEYVGLYHLMQDGTAMVGAGVLGAEHEINTDYVITYVGIDDSATETFDFVLSRFNNSNPRLGDLVVTINNETTYTIPSEGLELELFPGTLVRVEASNSSLVSRHWNGTFELIGLSEIDDQWMFNFVVPGPEELDYTEILTFNIDYEILDPEQLEISRAEVRERVADIFYKKFFESNVLTDEQILAVQSTIRDGKIRTGRQEDEQLVFYKKDRNTIESKKDLQGIAFSNIVEYVYARGLLLAAVPLENSFSSVEIGDPYVGDLLPLNKKFKDYSITFIPDNQKIVIATEMITNIVTNGGGWQSSNPPEFVNTLNLSQIVKSKIGQRINPAKASEVLDTNIFELLPNQTTRQDEIDKFFGDFNKLIGPPPATLDVDGDGANEYVVNDAGDRAGRVSFPEPSYENLLGTFITRLDSHTEPTKGYNTEANTGKTLESMRNRLNTYLGDVDNVVQVIPDQRPEYQNKSSGFLKIRKPNQAIILRNPNQELEFQKDNSYLTDGFTITMWVRFVGKTGRGTLFNFGNPISTDTPYGFRLETFTKEFPIGYKRMVRLVVYDGIDDQNKIYDSHFGTQYVNRYDTVGNSQVLYYHSNPQEGAYSSGHAFDAHTQIPTNDLNEWFFICATYNSLIQEETSHGIAVNQTALKTDKQFWLNHKDPSSGLLQSSTNFGARCKVEVISRSDLLRARGFKVGSLESNVGGEIPIDQEQQDQEQEESSA